MSFAAVEEAIRFEKTSPPTDETKSVRVRRGIYTMRNLPGRYMVRLRVPCGMITAAQLKVVADLARDSGWKTGAHFTTRQGLEFHGVPGARVVEFLERLRAGGLTTLLTGGNAVRAVVCCPWSGVSPDEAFDATPFALAVDRFFREHSELTRMPRKVKVAFDSCAVDHMRTLSTDIGLRGIKQRGRKGFSVTVGGGLGASPKVAQLLEEFVPVEELLPTVEAILRVFNREGDHKNRARSRLKWLLTDWGIERFQVAVRAEREKGSQFEGFWIPCRDGSRGGEVTPVDPVELAATFGAGEDFIRWAGTNVAAQRQQDLVSVSVRCPYGDMSPEQLLVLSEAIERFAEEGRISIDQNFILRGVRRASLGELYQLLRPVGLGTCCAGQLLDVTRCVGASGCLAAITDSRAAAARISEALAGDLAADPVLKNLRVRVSGCPNSCSHHHAADIGLFGKSKKLHGRSVPHYAFLVGGSASGDRPATRILDVPAARLPQAIADTLRLYRAERVDTESFALFVERTAASRLQPMLEALCVVPSPEDDPAFFRDLETEADFKVESKRGECAF